MPITLSDKEIFTQLLTAIKEAAAEGEHTDAMVAFILQEDVATAIAPDPSLLPEGSEICPTPEFHLTLGNLGDSTALGDLRQAVEDTLTTFSQLHDGPITGTIGGIGRFPTEDENGGLDPIYVPVDLPSLPAFRQALIETLNEAGIAPAANHGYTPHITLAYIPSDSPMPNIKIPTTPVSFNALALVWGGEMTTYPLSKASSEKAANVHAKAGETIAGNLVRGADGKFSSGSSSSGGDKSPEPKDGDKKKKTSTTKKPKLTPEQKKAAAEQKKKDNFDKVAGELSNSDLAEILTVGDDPNDMSQLNDYGKEALTKAGLGIQHADGSVELNGTGRALIRAMQRGDTKTANRLIKSAAARVADRNAKIDKKVKDLQDSKKAANPKIAQTMGEFKRGTLHSGSAKGPIVRDRKQAIAIALSQAGQAKKDVGAPTAVMAHGPGGLVSVPGLEKKVASVATLPRAGSLVEWRNSSGKKSRGRIVSVHKSSTIPRLPVRMAGTDKAPVAKVRVFKQHPVSGKWRPTKSFMGHSLSALSPVKTTKEKQPEPHLFIVKGKDGQPDRWITFSGSSYLDRDGETIAQKALEEDVARADQDGDYGPLLWWHLPELKLGQCDFNEMVGRVLVESGTFDSPLVAKAVADTGHLLGVSLGYNHPPLQRGPGAIFHQITRKERSLLPYTVASNTLTGVFTTQSQSKKEVDMTTKLDALKTLLGGGKEAEDFVRTLIGRAGTAEKAAQSQGLTFKAAGAVPATTTTKPAATPPEEEAEEETPDAEKAEEITADSPRGEEESEPNPDAGEEAEEETEYVTDITVAHLEEVVQEVVMQCLTPLIEAIASIGEAVGSQATKSVTETTALKEAVTKLTTRLQKAEKQVATLNGDVPRGVKRATERSDNLVTDHPALKEVGPAPDPYMAAIERLTAGLASSGAMFGPAPQ